MARKSDKGTYIISASEVSVFTVCPEAWRLREIQRAPSKRGLEVSKGKKAHDAWAKEYDELLDLLMRAKVVIGLLAVATIVLLATRFLARLP